MKYALLITALLSVPALAKGKVLNQQQFLKEVTAEMGEGFEDAELSIGGGCDIKVKESEGPNGHRVSVLLLSEGKQLIDMIVDAKDKVKMEIEEDGDGSYAKTYTFEFGNSLTRVHEDDASDYVIMDDFTSKLTCGVYQ